MVITNGHAGGQLEAVRRTIQAAAAVPIAIDAGDDYASRASGHATALRSAPLVEANIASPEPDTADPPTWPVLESAALYGLAGEIVRAATRQSEADPAAVLATLLGLTGIAIGRGPAVRVGDDWHHARLNSVLVGASARGRKGTSEKPIKRLWSIAEPLVLNRPDTPASIGLTLKWRPGPLSTGEGLIHAIRDPSDKRNEDGEPDDPGISDKRLFVVEGEFGAALRAMERTGNTLSTALRVAWDGGDLEPLTKSIPIRVTQPHVGIVGHITHQELSDRLSKSELFNGFANRFLWWRVRRAKSVPLAPGLSDADANRLGAELADRIAAASSLGAVEFTADARSIYEAIYPQLTEDKDGLWGMVTARSEAQVIRLALTYALLDASPLITSAHLEAAIAVNDYCVASAGGLFGSVAAHPLHNRLLTILGDGPRTNTELHAALGGHTDAANLKSALDQLQGRGRITGESRSTGGRRRTVWQLRAGFENARKAKKGE